MAKFAPDAVLDIMLTHIAVADQMWICSGQPTEHGDVADMALAGPIGLTPNIGQGAFSVDDAPGGGRQLTVAAQNGVTVDTSGEATHVVLVDSTESALMYVTTCTPQQLTQGNTVSVGEWSVTIADPS